MDYSKSCLLPLLSSLPSLYLPPTLPCFLFLTYFLHPQESLSDPIYFSAGFFQSNNGIGQNYTICYHNITVNSGSSSLETTELFTTNSWLNVLVTFVGSYQVDYSPVPPASVASDYQFWFVFLRENLNSDVTYSRLVRICRNDKGSNSSPDSFFSTFIKARIFCERDKPSGRASISTLDYKYNSISELCSCLFVCLPLNLCFCLPLNKKSQFVAHIFPYSKFCIQFFKSLLWRWGLPEVAIWSFF